MNITPSPIEVIKGSTQQVSVTGIVGTLSVTTANIGISVAGVEQTGASAQVAIQVYSNAIGSTGIVTFKDESGEQDLKVNMVSDSWDSNLKGEDVFSRQQELANLLQSLRSQLNSLTTLVSVGLAAQLAGVVASIASISSQIEALSLQIDGLGSGQLNIVG